MADTSTLWSSGQCPPRPQADTAQWTLQKSTADKGQDDSNEGRPHYARSPSTIGPSSPVALRQVILYGVKNASESACSMSYVYMCIRSTPDCNSKTFIDNTVCQAASILAYRSGDSTVNPRYSSSSTSARVDFAGLPFFRPYKF